MAGQNWIPQRIWGSLEIFLEEWELLTVSHLFSVKETIIRDGGVQKIITVSQVSLRLPLSLQRSCSDRRKDWLTTLGRKSWVVKTSSHNSTTLTDIYILMASTDHISVSLTLKLHAVLSERPFSVANVSFVLIRNYVVFCFNLNISYPNCDFLMRNDWAVETLNEFRATSNFMRT